MLAEMILENARSSYHVATMFESASSALELPCVAYVACSSLSTGTAPGGWYVNPCSTRIRTYVNGIPRYNKSIIG